MTDPYPVFRHLDADGILDLLDRLDADGPPLPPRDEDKRPATPEDAPARW